MKIICRLSCAIIVVAAGCAGGQPAPEPIQLSYLEAPAPFSWPGDYRRLAEKASGAYVRVVIYGETEDEGMPAVAAVNGASGTIVDPRGYVISAAHVVQHTRFHAKVTTTDGQVREGSILHVDPARELALLKIAPFPGMAVAPVGRRGLLRVGQMVLAIGAPGNRPGVVSPGRVANPRRAERIDYDAYGFNDAVELDMVVEPGHSGGPLFDAEGRLVGIIAGFGLGDTRRVPYISTRVGYAVPASAVAAYLNELVGGGQAGSPVRKQNSPNQ